MNHDVPVLSTFEPYNDDDDTMSIINMAFAEDNQLTVFKTEFHGMHNGRISANIDMSDEIAPYQNSRINLIYNHRHTNYAQCKPQNTAGTKYCRLTHYVYNEKVCLHIIQHLFSWLVIFICYRKIIQIFRDIKKLSDNCHPIFSRIP